VPEPRVIPTEPWKDWQRQALGEDARRHLKERVGVAKQTPGLPLSTALRRLPLDEGEVWTWAPPGTSVSGRELQGGLPKTMSQRGEQARLVEFIVKYLRPGGRLALIEDGSSPSAEWLTREPDLPPRVACEDRLYWPIESPDPAAVAKSLRWGLGLFNCIILTPVPLPREQQPGHLSLAQVQSLADLARHVIVDAFDFEGFVVWDRP
jgi:hypothetical protein